MPLILGQLGATLAGILMSMLGQLATERFVKHIVVRGLEVVVKKTQTDEDNKFVEDLKQAWSVQ